MQERSHPLARLSPEDQDMIVTFVLASGSIKDLARAYGVSYPTMRTRLNDLIERLRVTLAESESEPLTEYLAGLIERGQLASDVAREIRSLHRSAVERAKEGARRAGAA